MTAWTYLEQQVIALLETQKHPDGPWMTVEPYSIQRARELSDGAYGRLPAALVSVENADSGAANTGRTVFREAVTVLVAVLWKHPGTQQQQRHGTTYDEGLYDLVQRAVYRLADEEFDEYGWSALTPRRVRQQRINVDYTLVMTEFATNRRIDRDTMKGITYDAFHSLFATIETPLPLHVQIGDVVPTTWTFGGEAATWTFDGQPATWTDQ